MSSMIVPVSSVTASRSASRKASRKAVSSVPIEETHYSAAKFLALHACCSQASPLRVLAVVVLTPLPALLCAALLSLVPLQDPTLGFASKQSVLGHVCVGISVSSVGVILLTLGGTSTPQRTYPVSRIVPVTLVTTAITMVFADVKMKYWRFPMPILILMESPEWFMTLAVAHAIFLRDQFKHFPQLPAMEGKEIKIIKVDPVHNRVNSIRTHPNQFQLSILEY